MLPPVFGCTISIHALREEGDPGNVPCRRWRSIYFYPRPPRGGRRNFRQTATAKPTISIHALREEGDQALWFDGCHQAISIHALREEGDRGQRRPCAGHHDFYPRPPRGGRLPTRQEKEAEAKFLSTPSARRATAAAARATARPANFYPRPPRGGRPAVRTKKSLPRRHFYPRPPRGGRHADLENPTQAPMISIHALREEGDPSSPSMQRRHHYFYPRPPRGGRRSTSKNDRVNHQMCIRDRACTDCHNASWWRLRCCSGSTFHDDTSRAYPGPLSKDGH